ncbi:MAG: hypothetical protein ACOYOA_12875 [Saprospiraceae bacterium]
MKANLVLILFLTIQIASAQRITRDNKGLALTANFSLLGQIAGGDLKTRFGNSSAPNLSIDLMTDRGNWIGGAEFGYIFGRTVKEDPLTKIYNLSGKIYGTDFVATEIFLRQRGFWTGAYLGKLIPVSSVNKRSGIRLTIGFGNIQHKIRLQDDTKSVVQLDSPYNKGYDRLTGGWYVSEFIGYQHLSKNRRVNLMIGFDFMQGFTKSWRDWDWDLKSKNTEQRLDLLSGIRVGWSLPFYIGEASEEIYY